MSQASTASGKEMVVRWAAFWTGDTPTADYGTTISDGESPTLAQEVDALCRHFHPFTDPPPQDRPIFLFWKTHGTDDWALTRITHAPGSGAGRPVLEYYSLLFSPAEFESIGADPTTVIALDWFDQVQTRFKDGQHQPLEVAPPQPPAMQAPAHAPVTLGIEDRTEQMRAGGILEATGENLNALMDYCREQATRLKPPPTFATWWASEKEIPPETFHIVLRGNPPRALTPKEVRDTAQSLARDLKAVLPGPPRGDVGANQLFNSILAAADTIHSLIDTAYSSVDREPASAWQEQIRKASSEAVRIVNDLQGYSERQKSRLSAEEATGLIALWNRYDQFSQVLLKLRHPNPFSTRTSSGTGPRTNIFERRPGKPANGLKETRVTEPARERIKHAAPVPEPAPLALTPAVTHAAAPAVAPPVNPLRPPERRRIRKPSLITAIVLVVLLAGALLLAMKLRHPVSPLANANGKVDVAPLKDISSLPTETVNSYFEAAKDGVPALAFNWAHLRALSANTNLPADQNQGLTKAQVWKVAQDAIIDKVLEQVLVDKNTPEGKELQEDVANYLDRVQANQTKENKVVAETLNATLNQAWAGNNKALNDLHKTPVISRSHVPIKREVPPSFVRSVQPRPFIQPMAQRVAPERRQVYAQRVPRYSYQAAPGVADSGRGRRPGGGARTGHATSDAATQRTIDHLLH